MRLPELLLRAAAAAPDHEVICQDERRWTFTELLDAARRSASGALVAGVRPGEPVALLVSSPATFLSAYWGVVWAGATPVPLAGPRDASPEELGRVWKILESLGGAVVTDPDGPGLDPTGWTEAEPLAEPVETDAPALIQFSSGSTRSPRGVVLSHANLLANVRQVAARLPVTRDDIVHTWMPWFHDMGLIGCHLVPLALEMTQVRQSPVAAIRDPVGWVREALARGTTVLTTTPFALVRLLDRLQGDGGLDWSGLKLLVQGAEPIPPALCRRFSEQVGVGLDVHYPMYGLAEATVGVSSPHTGGLRSTVLGGRERIHCGRPFDGVEVRVVDPVDGVGDLQVRGPNVAAGYLGDPEATAALFDGDWVRTGDLGTLVDGEVVLTGRRKEVVCVNGRNLHAHDVEAVVEAVAGVHPGGAVAVADGRGASEGLALGVRVAAGAAAHEVLGGVRRAVTGQVGVAPSEVFPVERIPRTTSGKKRRARVRQDLEAGAYDDAVGNTLETVKGLWEEVLGCVLGSEDCDEDFRSLGGGSIQAIELLGRLEERLGVLPDHRVLLEGDTVRRMARLLERTSPTRRAVPSLPAVTELAITAAACRLPGADSPEAFWRSVRAGEVHIGPAPARWPGVGVGGFLDRVDHFDAEGFGIAPAEAAAMDPQQRLVLTLAAEALERAGGAGPGPVGVFVGAGQQAYLETVLDHLDEELPPGTMAGNLLNMLAARVSHHLDLRGPALTVDTACSASLVAVHLAAQSLRAGECRAALVAGVNLNLSDTGHRLFEVAGALSPSGRCRPFEPEADGMVPGEGAAVLLLRPLQEALADGSPILGVLLGSAINNDGASLGVMAPNPAGQEAVIRAALARAGVDPSAVGFVEAHGTGTRVGDAVEASVLARCYPHGPRRGAVKGHIGHLLGAAGAAGLLRLLGELGPDEVGAVSSFGFGGTNAHAIVRGGPPGAPEARAVTISAGQRHWLGEEPAPDLADWVHVVGPDPAGGRSWRPCPSGEPVLRQGGHYLVTGATGGLGRSLCRWLDRRHRARLELVSRRDDPVLRRGLRRARHHAVDLRSAEACRALIEDVGEVDGWFHLAGGTTPDALAAKRAGWTHLRELPAGFAVLFSSVAALLPGLALPDYSEANAWLDDQARQASGRHVVSIAWPPFTGAGLAAEHSEAFRERGLTPIAPRRAWAALERALASREPHVVVLHRPVVASAASPVSGELRERVRALLADAAELDPSEITDQTPVPALGIDSMQAVDLVEDLEGLVGRELPTTLLYEHPTLGSLLDALAAGTRREPAPVSAEPVPLLPAQQTFLVQARFFPEVPGNVLLACRVEGLQVRLLEPALTALVERHPVLATRFEPTGGSWVQVPGPSPSLEVVEGVDLEALHQVPFEPEQGPVLRVVTDGERLALNAHHAAVDAWSLKNALEELLALHEGLHTDAPVPAVPRTTAEEASAALHQAGSDDRAWWAARFPDGVAPLNLPWCAPPQAPTAGPFHLRVRALEAGVTTALGTRAQEAGVSLPALGLAIYMAVLFEVSGQHRVVVRVAHGRRDARLPDLERVVASLADSLPVRGEVRPGEAVVELARRVAAELTEVRQHTGASAMALGSLAPGDAPTGLAPAGFSFPLLPARTRIGALELSDIVGGAANGFTRLGLVAWVFDGRLHTSWNAPGSHLDAVTLEAIAERWLRRAADVAAGRDPEPRPATLHGRVLASCRAWPERPAIEGVSYGDLDRRSGGLARELGGERIAVLAYPGAAAVVALLAVMRSGAAYVPLDPDWPEARIQQVLEVARPSALVTTRELAGTVGGLRVLGVEDFDDPPTRDAPEQDGPIAYVMFTSGSTGRPKGVVVSHAAVLAFQDWVRAVFGVTSADRFVQTSSLGFGGSIRQIWAPLLAGASIHPVPRGLTRDPDGLVAFCRRERITIWNSVPSLWTHLVAALERTGESDPLPELRWMLLGGEAVPADPVRRWRERFGPRVRLANLYGSTESVVNATWHEVLAAPAAEERHTPIGRERSGVRVHLLDVEDGVGELAVGVAVAEGYLDDPARTAAAFVDVAGLGRVYRTGDLVRRRPDGALVHLGRVDAQVQVAGNRVELGEVEHALCNHPDVRGAVVLQDERGRLVATVEGVADAGALRSWLVERLPRYMVPARFEVVDLLPRTPAGKADRIAVRAGLVAEPELAVPAASQVARAWRDVLELSSEPGPDDDFFGLGGDSLRLLEVLDRLRAQGLDVPSPLVLYRASRLHEMAAAVGDAVEEPRLAPVALPEGPLPLAPVQRGFWLASRAGRSPTWSASVPVRGSLSIEAFEEALAALVARHESLRTVFGPGPEQRVLAAPGRLLLQRDDLRDLPEEHHSAALEARWQEACATRIDPERWPLVRVRLVQLDPERHELLLTAHHLVADAWSAWLLAAELVLLHDGARLPPAPPFRRWIAEDPPPDPWWAEALAGLEQRPAGSPVADQAAAAHVDPQAWVELQGRARAAGVTPFVWVLAAVAGALQEVLGTEDLVLSTALAERPVEARGVVGPFARGLPVRVRGPASVAPVDAAFQQAWAHAPAVLPTGLPLEVLGRYFLTWLDPGAVASPSGSLALDHARTRTRFATGATGTEVFVSVLVGEGLRVRLSGGARVHPVARALRDRLGSRPAAALVVYAPEDLEVPVAEPVVVETIDAPAGRSELVLLPRTARGAALDPALFAQVDAAVRATRAPVVALAGMLPTWTGLGLRPLGRPDQVLTTGHAATVVAMVLTVERVLEATGRTWTDLHLGVLGHGAIGQAVLALCRARLGEPAGLLLSDPALSEGVVDLTPADLILGATSGGQALEVERLRPGTVVVDDSFPRAFDDATARLRMETVGDVLLVGGGLLDVGHLERSSPFPQAAALRARFGARWLPGCHAEALLLAARPELGPTVGPVDLERALQVLAAVQALGWRAAPLHLGAWVVPPGVISSV